MPTRSKQINVTIKIKKVGNKLQIDTSYPTDANLLHIMGSLKFLYNRLDEIQRQKMKDQTEQTGAKLFIQ